MASLKYCLLLIFLFIQSHQRASANFLELPSSNQDLSYSYNDQNLGEYMYGSPQTALYTKERSSEHESKGGIMEQIIDGMAEICPSEKRDLSILLCPIKMVGKLGFGAITFPIKVISNVLFTPLRWGLHIILFPFKIIFTPIRWIANIVLFPFKLIFTPIKWIFHLLMIPFKVIGHFL